MKSKSTKKSLYFGLLFLLTGVVFVLLENTFYQYIDENGVLHESLFMPLGALALIIGTLLLLFFSVREFIALVKKRRE